MKKKKDAVTMKKVAIALIEKIGINSLKQTFHGIDADNEISLLEYGLIVSNELHEDGSGTRFCIYSIGNDQFDCGHISEDEINGYIDGKEFPDTNDIEYFLSFVGCGSKDWKLLSFASKLHDLLNYWGYENIFGTCYNPMTEKEVRERYL